LANSKGTGCIAILNSSLYVIAAGSLFLGWKYLFLPRCRFYGPSYWAVSLRCWNNHYICCNIVGKLDWSCSIFMFVRHDVPETNSTAIYRMLRVFWKLEMLCLYLSLWPYFLRF
jgi:hypothetical protein